MELQNPLDYRFFLLVHYHHYQGLIWLPFTLSVCLSLSLSLSRSFTISPHHPSIMIKIPDDIRTKLINVRPCLSINTCVHAKETIEGRILWVRPYISSSVPYFLLILLGWFVRWEASVFWWSVSILSPMGTLWFQFSRRVSGLCIWLDDEIFLWSRATKVLEFWLSIEDGQTNY